MDHEELLLTASHILPGLNCKKEEGSKNSEIDSQFQFWTLISVSQKQTTLFPLAIFAKDLELSGPLE